MLFMDELTKTDFPPKPQPEPHPGPEIGPVDEQGATKPIFWIIGTLAVVVLVATAAVIGYLAATRGIGQPAPPSPATALPQPSTEPGGVACTMEAKLCPDGSSVGRSGPNCEFAPCPTPTAADPQADWKTYTNGKYGFSIKYPGEYKALTSQDELSGWPNSVVLLYNGGQAYDIVVQVWDKEEDYQLAYPQAGNELTVQLVKGKYVTILDATKEDGNAGVIATFKAL
jgi:hypothetical protein